MLNAAEAVPRTAARSDVLVIGGGSVASTITARLAERGCDVVLFEKCIRDFTGSWHAQPVTFDFGNAMDKYFPHAYQVRRPEFDPFLLRNAVRKGATAVAGCRATGGAGAPRLQEAVRSVLAGDIFRDTPPALRLFVCKTVYYVRNIFNFRRTLDAWKRRRQIIGEPAAETNAS